MISSFFFRFDQSGQCKSSRAQNSEIFWHGEHSPYVKKRKNKGYAKKRRPMKNLCGRHFLTIPSLVVCNQRQTIEAGVIRTSLPEKNLKVSQE